MDSHLYNIAAVRNLIRAAFTADDLGRFCRDRPMFRFVLSHFGSRFSFEDMIEAVIEQCQTQALLPDLLAAIREHNPRQYDRYSGRLGLVSGGKRVVNLRPLDMTHTFKDREREIQLLREYLADSRVRLVSVVGRGGMGKTALICHVLADLQQGMLLELGEGKNLPIDGILYLGARTTGLGMERIYADVGRMLGEPSASRLVARWTHGDTDLTARVGYLLEAMQDGLYLVLLDNLEDHLAEDGEITDEGLRLFIERCLLQPGGARLVATTRQEIQLPVAALPRARSISLQEGLPDDDACALLHELDPQGRLGLRDASEEDLQRAIRLTQGIPRALELVAGILDHDPTANLPQLLADERLLGEQVVEELIAKSYSRLRYDDRRVMEVLAVFDRPMEEKAIAHLLQPWFPNLGVRDSLRRLVSSYFVSANRSSGEYSLHSLDREYAYHQLPDGDEEDAYNQRNLELRAADFYVSMRKPENEWKTIGDLAPQLAEFQHRVRAGAYNDACQILEQIDYGYLYLWGYYTRLIQLREQLLGLLTDPGLQASNFGSLGRSYRALGELERATEFYEQAQSIAHEIGHHQSEALWLRGLGNAYRDLGQVRQAMEFYRQALTISLETGDRTGQGQSLGELGFAYYSLGKMRRSIESCEQALAIAREVGDDRAESFWLGFLGIAYRALGQVKRAVERYEAALAITRATGHRWGESVWLNNLGAAYRIMGHVEQSITLHKLSLSNSREISDSQGERYSLLWLGKAYLEIGDLVQAQRYCKEALEVDFPDIGYQAALTLAVTLLHQGNTAARDAFADTTARCRALLDTTEDLYAPCYALAAALVGKAVCDPHWTEASRHAELLAPALAEYCQALENCSTKGVVQDALRDLGLIRDAGIEGLEPVFELLNSALVQNRARGCAVGAAIGDALGMPLEFGPPRPTDQLLREMEPGRLPAGTFTDDTEMALALADSLLAHRPLDPVDLAQRFVNWLQAGPDDVGIHTRNVLSRIAAGQPWKEAVEVVQQQKPDSAGNGSVMRCWPVALSHGAAHGDAHRDDPSGVSPSEQSLDHLLADSRLQSRVTHPHPECEAGSAFVNATIYYLLHGVPLAEAVAQALDAVDMPTPLRDVIEQAPTRSRDELKNSGWVRHTLESAVWGLLTTDTFEDAVVQVVNLGNDADTAGAVVGGLAGAAYGIDAIPLRWREALQGEWPLGSGTRWRAAGLVDLADRLVARSNSHGL